MTTTSTATRSAEVATCVPSSFPTNRSAINNTIVAFGSLAKNKYAASANILGYGGSPPRVYIGINTSNNAVVLGLFDAINAGASTASTGLPVGESWAVAGTFNRGEMAISLNGSVAAASISPQIIEAIPMRFYIGMRSDNVAWWNGYITRVIYIPQKLNAFALQDMTSIT